MTVKKANGAGIVDAAMASVNPSPTPSPLEVIRGLWNGNKEETTKALFEATLGLIKGKLLNSNQLKALIEAAAKAL
jgi:hypothetical protein